MAGATALVLCLIAGGQPAVRVPADHFTLSWTHSIEKVEWQEDYRITGEGLILERSRVKGSGVGMEPAPDAKLIDGWWVGHPVLPPLPDLTLAASNHAGDHVICAQKRCASLHDWLGGPVEGPVRMVACPIRD
ncbi:DUF1850 domain-containing protein [Niveispirillum sp.]|uniref:DUF1850 domain-containing protein n=1 Tax=Niveispirillum sp. TaxID=1917217 RepID=UPI001B737A06|nr:DUF1850 domain-containing protein [Niveispirillum sp.]MBP7336088.1 DUF1850 domain-containing protein [Niveispirillum sp.]